MSWLKNIVDFIKDLTKEDVASEIRERITNPLFIALFFGWVVINWELVFILFYSDGDFTLDKKIGKINTYITDDETIWLGLKSKLFFEPIKYAFGAIVILSLLKQIALLITAFVSKKVKPVVYKLVDKNKLVLKEVYDELIGKQYRLDKAHRKLIEETTGYRADNEELSKIASDWEIKVNELTAEINTLKTKSEYLGEATEVFVFTRQEEDEHYYKDILNLRSYWYEIAIKPDDKTDYWRCGLKFSKDEEFSNQRHSPQHPLVHLTKNKNSDELKLSYYDETNKLAREDIVFRNYNNQLVRMIVWLEDDVVTIDVVGGLKRFHAGTQQIIGWKFCQLFAWGDSNEFVLNTQITENN